MHQGTIKWYDETKGYGVIVPDKGDKDVVFRSEALQGFAMLPAAGDRVAYTPVDPRRGTQAESVRPE